MAQGQVSLKRLGVDKANSRILLITAVAAFLSMFFIVASYSLFTQVMYKNRVIGVKKTAVTQLQANIKARDSLIESYSAFINTPQNIIGGNPEGTGPNDGTNAKIVLDALPSKYDFPALTTSIEKLMTEQKVQLRSLTGNDDEIAQSETGDTNAPQLVEVPFEASVVGDYAGISAAVKAFERSIRPMQIQKVQLAGSQSELTLTVSAKTFYQPVKALSITKKVVK